MPAGGRALGKESIEGRLVLCYYSPFRCADHEVRK